MKLEQKSVNTLDLPKGKTETIIFDNDVPGFGLRIRRGGARTWVYQFKLGVQQRRITLGSATALSLAQVRKTASELHAKVRLGRDPAGEKAEGRVRAGETMAAALQSYLTLQRTRLKPLSVVQVERHLGKHAKPLHGLQLGKIGRREVAARLAAITARSGPVESNRVRASLSAFFAWAIREGLIDANPVVGTGRHEEKSRERVLNDDELKAIWTATADDGDYCAIVRLLMLTAARANEIGALRWSEVFADRIALPPGRTKNSRPHLLPLAPVARAILDGRPRQPDRDFVFGRREERPFTGWSVSKMALDGKLSGVAPWVHHDLRRSAATRMAELGVQPHIIEAVLNHVSGHKAGVAGIYNRASYEREKAAALARWADALMAIVGGRAPKVVLLRSA